MAKWKPNKQDTLKWADDWAKKICGPQGHAAFIKQFEKAHRYTILARYQPSPGGAFQMGIVGSGSDWVSAVADAQKNIAEAVAQRTRPAEPKP